VTQAPAGAASHCCAGNSRFFADLIEAGFINNKLTLNDLVEDGTQPINAETAQVRWLMLKACAKILVVMCICISQTSRWCMESSKTYLRLMRL
jgi:hypothetical protein